MLLSPYISPIMLFRTCFILLDVFAIKVDALLHLAKDGWGGGALGEVPPNMELAQSLSLPHPSPELLDSCHSLEKRRPFAHIFGVL